MYKDGVLIDSPQKECREGAETGILLRWLRLARSREAGGGGPDRVELPSSHKNGRRDRMTSCRSFGNHRQSMHQHGSRNLRDSNGVVLR